MKTLEELCKLVNSLDTAHVMALQVMCQEHLDAESTAHGLAPDEQAELNRGNRSGAVRLVQMRLGLMTEAANRYINRALHGKLG